MPYSNISATISAANKAAIMGYINSIKALLPFLINLTEEEKRALPMMSDRRFPFVIKAVEYAGSNPTLVPPFVSYTEGNKDLVLNNDLRQILEALAQLYEAIDETRMAVSSEAYDFARVFYNSVREASKRNVPGSGTIANDLGELFAAKSVATKPTPPTV